MAAGRVSSGTSTSKASRDAKCSPARRKRKLSRRLPPTSPVFKFPSVERTTYDRLECTAQHQVFPLIGEKIVGDITAADLKSVLNHWMEQGYAYTTVKKVHILLNEYFRYLTEEDFIQKSPMQSVPMMKRANFLAAQDKECVPEQEAVTVFTPTEIAKFIRHICQRQAQIPASRRLHPHAEYRPTHGRIARIAQQRHRLGAAGFASRKRCKRGLAQRWSTSRAGPGCESWQAEVGNQQADYPAERHSYRHDPRLAKESLLR